MLSDWIGHDLKFRYVSSERSSSRFSGSKAAVLVGTVSQSKILGGGDMLAILTARLEILLRWILVKQERQKKELV